MMTTQTYDDCRARVAGNVIGVSVDQIDAIAAHHFQTGDNVWHSAHVVLDTLRVCPCFHCQTKRAA
jgi:hypothetical protein